MGKLALEITEKPIIGNAGLAAMGELMRISDIDSTCAKRESPDYWVAEKDILRYLGGLIGIGKVGFDHVRQFKNNDFFATALDQSAASRAQDLSVSAAWSCDQTTGSGVVRRHHVCPHETGFSVSGGSHGLAQPSRAVLAAIQHPGRRFLRCRLGRSQESSWGAGNLQHRPGLAVHEPGFTRVLKDAGVAISMDGKGRWMDNVFIERLWRSVKWECIYLRELETGSQARQALGNWFHFYNERRPHTAFDGRRPMDVYWEGHSAHKAA